MLAGVLMLPAGIGVIRRSNWARFLMLGVAGFALFGELVALVAKAIVKFTPGDFASGLFSVVLTLAFAGFAYTVLLMPRFAREFRSPLAG